MGNEKNGECLKNFEAIISWQSNDDDDVMMPDDEGTEGWAGGNDDDDDGRDPAAFPLDGGLFLPSPSSSS